MIVQTSPPERIALVDQTHYETQELCSDGSFIRNIRAQLEDLRTTTGVETSLRISYVWPPSVPVAVADNVTAIVSEALTMIRAHGVATRVEIYLGADVDGAFLVLMEDGKWSPWSRRVPEQSAPVWAIQERAARLASYVEVIESEGKGSKLRVVLPPW